MDPMSKAIDQLLTEIDALREQIGRLKVEREQMKRTCDKRVEQLERALKAAHVEGLREAGRICNGKVHAIECVLAIHAEIAALERKHE